MRSGIYSSDVPICKRNKNGSIVLYTLDFLIGINDWSLITFSIFFSISNRF